MFLGGEGEVVWARMTGYPWWPAVISPASVPPKVGRWKKGLGRQTKYHCTFLAWNKETAWMEGNRLRTFKRTDGVEGRRKEYLVKQGDLKNSHSEAIELAIGIMDDPTNPLAHLVVEKKLRSEGRGKIGFDTVDILEIIGKKDFVIEKVDTHKIIEKVEVGVIKANIIDNIGGDKSKVEIPSVPDVLSVKLLQRVEINPSGSVDVDECRQPVPLPNKSAEEMISELSDGVKQLISKGHLFLTPVVEPGRSGQLPGKKTSIDSQAVSRLPGIEHHLGAVIATGVGKKAGEENVEHCEEDPGSVSKKLLEEKNYEFDASSKQPDEVVDVEMAPVEASRPALLAGIRPLFGPNIQQEKVPSSEEKIHCEIFSLEGEPEFLVVAEYDEESKKFIRDGQEIDLKTLVEQISQESFEFRDNSTTLTYSSPQHSHPPSNPDYFTDLMRLKSPGFLGKRVKRCPIEARIEFDKTDPALPDGFRVREKVREDGIRIDREFMNSEGTMIFRSRTAVWDYVKYVALHSAR